MKSLPKTLSLRKAYPPVQADAEILCRWFAPCELLPEGQAGFVRVNEQVYMLLPLADQGAVVGYRLTKSDGKVYDIDTTGRDWVCDCPDSQFRHRRCKHAAALLLILAADKVAQERAAAADDAAWDEAETRWQPTAAARHADDAWIDLDVQPGIDCTCRNEAEHIATCGKTPLAVPVLPLPPRPARKLPAPRPVRTAAHDEPWPGFAEETI